jgi:hypothetical protein
LKRLHAATKKKSHSEESERPNDCLPYKTLSGFQDPASKTTLGKPLQIVCELLGSAVSSSGSSVNSSSGSVNSGSVNSRSFNYGGVNGSSFSVRLTTGYESADNGNEEQLFHCTLIL